MFAMLFFVWIIKGIDELHMMQLCAGDIENSILEASTQE